MAYRIAHQKWLVQCANLMSSFLLVTEIHAFKVLPSPYTRSLRSHWSLLGPDGKDSEGRTWVHWIVHQKWPVQCANLMNLFLLVNCNPCIQSPSNMTVGHWSLLEPDGWESEGRTWIHWVVHQKWPVQCANLLNSFRLVAAIHGFKVLPRPSF